MAPSSTISPPIMRLANPLYNWLNPKIPERWKQAMTNYSEGFKVSEDKTLTFKTFVINQFKNMVIYGCIIFAITLIAFSAIGPLFVNNIGGIWGDIAATFISLVLVSPFIWAMAFKYNISLTNKRLISKTTFESHVISIIFIIRYLIAIGLIMMIIKHYIPLNVFLSLGIAIVGSMILAFSNGIMKFYDKLEKRFNS